MASSSRASLHQVWQRYRRQRGPGNQCATVRDDELSESQTLVSLVNIVSLKEVEAVVNGMVAASELMTLALLRPRRSCSGQLAPRRYERI